MKKTHQAIISILSLIIMLTFTESVFAQEACVIKWWTDTCQSNYELCTEKNGWQSTLENAPNEEAAEEVYGELFPTFPGTWLNEYTYGYMYILNPPPTPDYIIAQVLLNNRWNYDYKDSKGGSIEKTGGWDVYCGTDTDGDGLPESIDNCPDFSNSDQEDADNDNIGDVCDPDTIYGTISGAVQGGVSIDINVYSCGTATTVATITTNDEGYYAVGELETDSYGIVPQFSDYVFSPKTQILRVPQTNIRSYDFTATSAP